MSGDGKKGLRTMAELVLIQKKFDAAASKIQSLLDEMAVKHLDSILLPYATTLDRVLKQASGFIKEDPDVLVEEEIQRQRLASIPAETGIVPAKSSKQGKGAAKKVKRKTASNTKPS